MDTSSTVMAVVPLGVASLVWLIRLEGRVNGHELIQKTLRDEQADMRADIQYIRERIDRALNGRNR